jgi:hypothetical protein
VNQVVSTVSTNPGLSQLKRLACAFVAPSLTFEDIRDGHRSWWMPFLVISLLSYLLFAVVSQRIGIDQTIQNQIRMSPAAQGQLSQATPEQIDRAQSFWRSFTQIMFVAGPAVSLLCAALLSAIFLGTINFAFGGRASFVELIAVTYYAWLPQAVQLVMGMIVIWFQAPETFNIKNFAPTNPAALLLDPATSGPALYAFASQIDIITIWTLVLFSIGVSTVAGVKRSSGFITVFGWWILYVIYKVGVAAAFS